MWRKYRNKEDQSIIRGYLIDRKQSIFKIRVGKNPQRILSVQEGVVGRDRFKGLTKLAKLGRGLNRYIIRHELKFKEEQQVS